VDWKWSLVHDLRARRHPRNQASTLAHSPLALRPSKVAPIALANKSAMMAWAIMARSERYKVSTALAT
jgi:hypothetical protein